MATQANVEVYSENLFSWNYNVIRSFSKTILSITSLGYGYTMPNVIMHSYMIQLSRIGTLSFITLDTSAEDS